MQFSVNTFAVFDSLVEAVRKTDGSADIVVGEVDLRYLSWIDVQPDIGWRRALLYGFR